MECVLSQFNVYFLNQGLKKARMTQSFAMIGSFVPIVMCSIKKELDLIKTIKAETRR